MVNLPYAAALSFLYVDISWETKYLKSDMHWVCEMMSIYLSIKQT